jgi:hypothetical protein
MIEWGRQKPAFHGIDDQSGVIEDYRASRVGTLLLGPTGSFLLPILGVLIVLPGHLVSSPQGTSKQD